MARFASGAARDDERHDAKDERERRHQDRTQTNARGLDRRLGDRQSARAELLRKLDDEDAVLRRQPDQHHEADLAVDIVDQSARPLRAERAENRDRHRQKNDERQRDAFVLRRERQIHEQQSESEDDQRLAARLDFFDRQSGPRVRKSLRQRAVRQLLHDRERLAGAVARRGRSIDLRRAEQVVVRDVLRRRGLTNRHDVAERHHRSARRPRVVALDVRRIRSEFRIRLHVDAVRTVVEVEVVDVGRSEQHLQRSRDAAQRETEAFRLLAIDVDDNLRIVRRELREQRREPGRLVALRDQLA